MVVATLMSHAMFLTLKKKILLGLLIVSIIAAWKMHKEYRKLLMLILVMSVIPTAKCEILIYEHQKAMDWEHLPASIVEAKFKETPNIYMIYLNGYVARKKQDGE